MGHSGTVPSPGHENVSRRGPGVKGHPKAMGRLGENVIQKHTVLKQSPVGFPLAPVFPPTSSLAPPSYQKPCSGTPRLHPKPLREFCML